MQIRRLSEADSESILAFAYEREKENIFLIESFRREAPFDMNVYIGVFENRTLIGIGTYYGLFQSLTVHAQKMGIIDQLTDCIVRLDRPIEAVPDLQEYAGRTIERLKYHGLQPKTIRKETFYILEKGHFHDHPLLDVKSATSADIDDIVLLSRLINEPERKGTVTDVERSRVHAPYDCILRNNNNELLSNATIHGYSDHYALVGGVATHPEHRRKGCAKGVVCFLCRKWLTEGKKILLFCSDTNEPAIRTYKALGFKTIGKYLIALY